MEVVTEHADLYHIQFEYRAFSGIARSLVILPLLTAFLRSRGPVVVTLHGLVTPDSLRARKLKGIVYLAYRSSMRMTGTFASAFVVHSEQMRTVGAAQYGLHDIFMIPLGSDAVPFVEAGRTASPHVVFFGFIRPEKGIEHLIEAIRDVRKEVPNVRLTIAGSVIYQEEQGYLDSLRERVTAEGLSESVRFLTKYLTEDEICELMQDASVIVLPYTDRFVEVSAIVHELAGYGVPLICSNTPRFSELVDGVDCLKVAPDSSEIANAILRISKEPALAARLGEGLWRRSRTESWDVVAEMHLEMYRQVLRTGSLAALSAH